MTILCNLIILWHSGNYRVSQKKYGVENCNILYQCNNVFWDMVKYNFYLSVWKVSIQHSARGMIQKQGRNNVWYGIDTVFSYWRALIV